MDNRKRKGSTEKASTKQTKKLNKWAGLRHETLNVMF